MENQSRDEKLKLKLYISVSHVAASGFVKSAWWLDYLNKDPQHLKGFRKLVYGGEEEGHGRVEWMQDRLNEHWNAGSAVKRSNDKKK